jgi:argininosuccinate synthase
MTRIVLAYSGSLEATVAIRWLAAAHDAELVTLTLDVGQDRPVEQLRARALACGAVRAHVIDAREEFARECVVPSLHAGARRGEPRLAPLARPLVARKLVEVAAIEESGAVAHASRDERFDGDVAAVNPALRVLAPVREWQMDARALTEYIRANRLPVATPPPEDHAGQNLLVRPAADPASAPDGEARVELTFSDHVPVAINGVPMSAAELIESLSLIAGQYGIGWRAAIHAPAAWVLHAAYAALRDPAGRVCLRLSRGQVSFA